jgi:hypothetical protein
MTADIDSVTPPPSLGPLVAALAKAQTEFATVTRDKTVTVQTKTGGSYKFSYAPLDTILAAVRGPLSDNGLVLVQTLDDGALVTSLLHESGGSISGRMALPGTNDIQGLGSAITYLRRYAIQAVLGIAAEEDDDGNHAAGNTTQRGPKGVQRDAEDQDENAPVSTGDGEETLTFLGKLQKVGTIQKGGPATYQCVFQQAPDGHVFGFKLKLAGDERDIPQVLVKGAYGEGLFMAYVGETQGLIGSHVTVKGRLYNVSKTGRKSYYRLVIGEAENDLIETPVVRIPALVESPEAESAPLPWEPLDDEERALVAGGLPDA